MKQPPSLRIGILGGTFNPPHIAHLAIADISRRALNLDMVLLLPNSTPSYKSVEVSAETRHAMTVLAAESCKGMQVSSLELQREGTSYTVEALWRLKELYPHSHLFLIVGSDILADIASWYGADEIFRLAEIVAVQRPGVSGIESAATYLRLHCHANLTILTKEAPKMSSTAIRTLVHNALPASSVLCPSVEQYIYENGLYFPREVRTVQNDLRAKLDSHRYTHAMRVVLSVVRIAALLGENGSQARMAALLWAKGESFKNAELDQIIQMAVLECQEKACYC